MRNSSTGGTDFIVMAVKSMKPHISLGKIVFAADAVIILLGGVLLEDFDGIIYGLIVNYIYALVVDKLMYGMNAGKLALVERAAAAGTPIICSMGTGNKLDASAFQVADISKTSMCPLARIMRKELKKRGINHVKVVYSQEEALSPAVDAEELERTGKRQIPGSTAFVPGAAGLILAGEVIKDLIKER